MDPTPDETLPSTLARLLAGSRDSPRLRVIAHRLIVAVPVLLGVSLLTFFVLDLLPGSAAQQLLGPEATAEQIARLEVELGLNHSAWQRYLVWLENVATGDLGRSLASRQPVRGMLADRIYVTVELVFCAFVLSLCLAVPAAILAAHKAGTFTDRLMMLLSTAGLSAASYVLALVLVLLFAVKIHICPAFGFTPPSESLLGNLHSLVLPAAAIALPLFCFYARFLRGDLVEQMDREEYVITARAKGLDPWRILLRHAFRNSLFGLLTVVGLNLGTLIGSTVVIEQIFALPGIGQLLLQAINTRDATVVQAIVLLLAVVTVLANLGVDLLYTALDPRVRYGYES
jgi:peptide/nickel transport system permease protein